MNGAGTTSNKLDVKNCSPGLALSPMRKCTGCRIRRSITQFDQANAMCIRCARRTPCAK
jgi:hypothetical protein